MKGVKRIKEEKGKNDVALLTRPRRNKELRTAFSHAPLKSNKLKFSVGSCRGAFSSLYNTKFEKNRLLPFSVFPTFSFHKSSHKTYKLLVPFPSSFVVYVVYMII